MTKDIDNYHPFSGRFVKEDGTTVNIADEFGGKSVSDKVYDIDNMMPHSGRFIKEDGTCANIADMIANGDIGGGGGSSDDSAPPVTETYNGQVIQCSMSADRPLQGLNLYATCQQKTTAGANLFNESGWVKKTTSGITVEWLQDEGCFLLNGTATETDSMMTSIDIVAEKGATYALQNYYVSGEISVPAGGSAVTCFGASDTEGLFNDWLGCSLKEEDTNLNSECNYNYITRFWFFITIGVVLNNYKVRIQLAKSSVSLPYEPYTGGIPSPNGDYPQEIQAISDFVVEVKNSMGEVATPQTLNIVIPDQGFYGIPVSSGGNYTDTDGQQWICDEFDYKRGKYIQRVRKVILNGSESERWYLYNFSESENLVTLFRKFEGTKIGQGTSICNMFINKEDSVWDTEGIWVYADHFTLPNKYFNVPKTTVSTLEEWKTWLSTHPLEVLYSLATPVEYDLTDEQVEQFKKLRSYYGTTYIDNDAVPGCNVTAELVVDTKMYIDSKFTTLAGQILEMGV